MINVRLLVGTILLLYVAPSNIELVSIVKTASADQLSVAELSRQIVNYYVVLMSNVPCEAAVLAEKSTVVIDGKMHCLCISGENLETLLKNDGLQYIKPMMIFIVVHHMWPLIDLPHT